jgi:hypothetical protein
MASAHGQPSRRVKKVEGIAPLRLQACSYESEGKPVESPKPDRRPAPDMIRRQARRWHGTQRFWPAMRTLANPRRAARKGARARPPAARAVLQSVGELR